MCAVTIAVQHLLCSGDTGGTTTFSEDGTILENLVFLDEGNGGGPDETLLDRVRRVVWGRKITKKIRIHFNIETRTERTMM